MWRKGRQVAAALLCTGALLAPACADEQDMYDMASALTKLSAAVDAQLFFSPAGVSLSDSDLLTGAASSQPDLLARFSSYLLRIHRFPSAVVLLLCRSEQEALLEDVSCTARLDRHHWRDAPATVCAPTTDVLQTCSR